MEPLHPCCGVWCGRGPWLGSCCGGISGDKGLDARFGSARLLLLVFPLPLFAQELSEGEDASPSSGRGPSSLTFVSPARAGTLRPEMPGLPSVNSEAMR